MLQQVHPHADPVSLVGLPCILYCCMHLQHNKVIGKQFVVVNGIPAKLGFVWYSFWAQAMLYQSCRQWQYRSNIHKGTLTPILHLLWLKCRLDPCSSLINIRFSFAVDKHTLTKARRIPHYLDVTVRQLIGNMRVTKPRFQNAPFCPRFQNFMPVCNSRSNSVLLNLLQDQCTVSNFGDTNFYQILSKKNKTWELVDVYELTHLVSFVKSFPEILFSMNFLAYTS